MSGESIEYLGHNYGKSIYLLCSELETGSNVILLKIRITIKYLFLIRSAGKELEYIQNSNSQMSDARLPAALLRVRGNSFIYARGDHTFTIRNHAKLTRQLYDFLAKTTPKISRQAPLPAPVITVLCNYRNSFPN